MIELISEDIVPSGPPVDAGAMARGEPGLPAGFTWREQTVTIVHELERWKQSSPEGGRKSGEVYLRRHYYKLQMDDESTWVVYCLRQAIRSGAGRRRWFLYTRETD